ncbi:MAG: DNA adenine methylase [Chloroflexia bacterium]
MPIGTQPKGATVDRVPINSPFRYAGGKFYARKLILEQMIPHSYYAEPFAGGGSIFFAKSKAATNLLNDADPELVNCYIHIRDHVEELIALLDGIGASKENHTYYKNVYRPTNELERAFRWYYLNRTSYSGIMNAPNCYWGYGDIYSMQPKNWPGHLRRCSAKLQDVQITCADFAQTIEQAPDGAFLFVDPPYFNADQDKFYTYSFTRADHLRLAEVLHTHSHRLSFLLTYDNSPEVRALYQWAAAMLDKEWNYTINRTDDQTKKTTDRGKRYMGREVFILSYDPAAVAHQPVAVQLPLVGFPADLAVASSGRRSAEQPVSAG